MKKKIIKLAILVSLALAFAIPFVVFMVRAPVLIVSDQSFIMFYGTPRIRRQSIQSSLSFFRQFKTVAIADDAGDDILQYAIAEVSQRPYCVLFPLRYARGARIYREQNPQIPVILLEGRFTETANRISAAINNNPDDYFIYKTDIESDFHIMGLTAAILDGEKNGRILVYLESHIQAKARESISRALNEAEKPLRTTYYTSYSQTQRISNLSSVILAGVGAEYFDRNAGIPIICQTWVDPALLPVEVVLVFDDSPWNQAAEAVRMAAAGIKTGVIPSNCVILPGKDIDNETLQKIKNLCKIKKMKRRDLTNIEQTNIIKSKELLRS
ncbi:MAG: hypothetical protein LBH16_06140 [Treponema sp.]|jgi:hypothetical protein|nr:hypothetical protein [Treponema sp.]